MEGFQALDKRPLCTATAESVCSRIRGVTMQERRVPGTKLVGGALAETIYTPPEGGREKLFVHPCLMTLLTGAGNEFEPYADSVPCFDVFSSGVHGFDFWRKTMTGRAELAVEDQARVRALFHRAPFVRDLGIELDALGEGWCETSLAVRPTHLQQDGFVQAGP